MTKRLFVFLTVFIFSCSSSKTKTDSNIEAVSNTPISAKYSDVTKTSKPDIIVIPETHLRDTTFISGSFVLFLRPDSLRFESYTHDPKSGIYEVDSDFGFAISATMDSISKYNRHKSIKTIVSDRRFIVINDCKYSPLTIDRDTIDYGLILTTKGKEIKINTFLHSEDYFYDVDEYFKTKKGGK